MKGRAVIKSRRRTDDDEPVKPSAKAELLARARREFKIASEWDDKQRKREAEDLAYQVPDLQWSAAAKRERDGGLGQPPRPRLSITKIDQPVRLVVNQFRAADLGITIHPRSETANHETAEIFQGIYRHIEHDSKAEIVRGWAYDRSVKAGRGYWRVLKAYDDCGCHPGDMKLVIKRILHQDRVYVDPAAEEFDLSDARFMFVASWVPRDTFKAQHPGAKMDASDQFEWEGLRGVAPEWASEEKGVLVAEYWWRDVTYEDIKGKNGYKRERVTVRCVKMTGAEVLEEYEWEGSRIPIFPCWGRELQPVDGERIWFGLIRPTRDAQQLYNVSASTVVEEMGAESKTPYVGAEGQFEGHKQKWMTAHLKNYGYLEYRPKTFEGQLVPPPQRMQIDASKMHLAMETLREADQFIQATTAIHEQSLGKRRQDESGRAIQALQQQSDASTSDFLMSMTDISMPAEAACILEMIPHVYDCPGRVVTIIRGDDRKSEQVMVNAPYVMDQKSKRPRQVQKGQRGAKFYNLKEGHYSVVFKAGKAFQTRLDEGAAELGAIIEARPELMEIIGDLYFQFRDFPGAKEMSKRFGRMIDAKMPFLKEPPADGQMDPEQLTAQNQALQAKLKEAEQGLQAMQQQLAIDAKKQEAMLQKTDMDNRTRVLITEMQNAAKLQIEEMRAGIEERMTALEHAHATRVDHEQRAHETALAAAGGSSISGSRDVGQEQGNEMTDEMSEEPAPLLPAEEPMA